MKPSNNSALRGQTGMQQMQQGDQPDLLQVCAAYFGVGGSAAADTVSTAITDNTRSIPDDIKLAASCTTLPACTAAINAAISSKGHDSIKLSIAAVFARALGSPGLSQAASQQMPGKQQQFFRCPCGLPPNTETCEAAAAAPPAARPLLDTAAQHLVQCEACGVWQHTCCVTGQLQQNQAAQQQHMCELCQAVAAQPALQYQAPLLLPPQLLQPAAEAVLEHGHCQLHYQTYDPIQALQRGAQEAHSNFQKHEQHQHQQDLGDQQQLLQQQTSKIQVLCSVFSVNRAVTGRTVREGSAGLLECGSVKQPSLHHQQQQRQPGSEQQPLQTGQSAMQQTDIVVACLHLSPTTQRGTGHVTCRGSGRGSAAPESSNWQYGWPQESSICVNGVQLQPTNTAALNSNSMISSAYAGNSNVSAAMGCATNGIVSVGAAVQDGANELKVTHTGPGRYVMFVAEVSAVVQQPPDWLAVFTAAMPGSTETVAAAEMQPPAVAAAAEELEFLGRADVPQCPVTDSTRATIMGNSTGTLAHESVQQCAPVGSCSKSAISTGTTAAAAGQGAITSQTCAAGIYSRQQQVLQYKQEVGRNSGSGAQQSSAGCLTGQSGHGCSNTPGMVATPEQQHLQQQQQQQHLPAGAQLVRAGAARPSMQPPGLQAPSSSAAAAAAADSVRQGPKKLVSLQAGASVFDPTWTPPVSSKPSVCTPDWPKPQQQQLQYSDWPQHLQDMQVGMLEQGGDAAAGHWLKQQAQEILPPADGTLPAKSVMQQQQAHWQQLWQLFQIQGEGQQEEQQQSGGPGQNQFTAMVEETARQNGQAACHASVAVDSGDSFLRLIAEIPSPELQHCAGATPTAAATVVNAQPWQLLFDRAQAAGGPMQSPPVATAGKIAVADLGVASGTQAQFAATVCGAAAQSIQSVQSHQICYQQRAYSQQQPWPMQALGQWLQQQGQQQKPLQQPEQQQQQPWALDRAQTAEDMSMSMNSLSLLDSQTSLCTTMQAQGSGIMVTDSSCCLIWYAGRNTSGLLPSNWQVCGREASTAEANASKVAVPCITADAGEQQQSPQQQCGGPAISSMDDGAVEYNRFLQDL